MRRRVYYYLREKMDKGLLLPGAAINLNEIADVLGVSKTPLRDAMIKLEAEGFVTIWPRRGIVVNVLELEDIKYLYEVMAAMEATILLTIQDRIEKVHLDRLRSFNSDMRIALEHGDYGTYDEMHWSFHGFFIDLSNNMFVQRLLTPVKHRLLEFPRRGFLPEWEKRACDEHESILDAIENGDHKEAARLIRQQHWDYEHNEKYIRRVYFGERIRS